MDSFASMRRCRERRAPVIGAVLQIWELGGQVAIGGTVPEIGAAPAPLPAGPSAYPSSVQGKRPGNPPAIQPHRQRLGQDGHVQRGDPGLDRRSGGGRPKAQIVIEEGAWHGLGTGVAPAGGQSEFGVTQGRNRGLRRCRLHSEATEGADPSRCGCL